MTGRWREVAAAGHANDEPTARAALGSSDDTDRVLALGALHRMGRLSDDDVRASFRDVAAGVRRRGVMIAAGRASISLLSMLADPDVTVVEAAAWAAGEQVRVGDDVLGALVALATEATDALVREASVAALGAIGDERGLPAILAGCNDKSAIRRRAVLALAPFSGAEVDAALAAALEDRDWQVRQAAEDIAPFMRDG